MGPKSSLLECSSSHVLAAKLSAHGSVTPDTPGEGGRCLRPCARGEGGCGGSGISASAWTLRVCDQGTTVSASAWTLRVCGWGTGISASAWMLRVCGWGTGISANAWMLRVCDQGTTVSASAWMLRVCDQVTRVPRRPALRPPEPRSPKYQDSGQGVLSSWKEPGK